MDTASQVSKEEYLILEAQLRENYGKIIYSHKTQEKCADLLTKQNNIIKNVQIILAAIVTTGIFLKLLKDEQWALVISLVVSTLQLALTSFLKEFKLGETIQKHQSAALEIWDVREEYLSLLTDLKSNGISLEEARVKRDKLLSKLSKTYKGSPRTFSKAYERARKALQIDEELTFTEKEIDKFLPAELRRSL